MAEPRPSAAAPPSSWLAPAVVTTLCCFPLTGVIGVYFAAQVRVRWEHGDTVGAELMARRARFWVLLGFVIFLVMVAVGIATGSLVDLADRMRG